MAARKKLTFEEGMDQLEDLVRQLEAGDLPLEKSFDAYAKGVELVKQLSGQLDAGEKRIMELTAQGEKPFEEEL